MFGPTIDTTVTRSAQLKAQLIEYHHFVTQVKDGETNAPEFLFIHELQGNDPFLIRYNIQNVYDLAVNEGPSDRRMEFNNWKCVTALNRAADNVSRKAVLLSSFAGGTLAAAGSYISSLNQTAVTAALFEMEGASALGAATMSTTTSLMSMVTAGLWGVAGFCAGGIAYFGWQSGSEYQKLKKEEKQAFLRVSTRFNDEFKLYMREIAQMADDLPPISEFQVIHLNPYFRNAINDQTPLPQMCKNILEEAGRNRRQLWRYFKDAMIFSTLCRCVSNTLPDDERLNYLRRDLRTFSEPMAWRGKRSKLTFWKDISTVSAKEQQMINFFYSTARSTGTAIGGTPEQQTNMSEFKNANATSSSERSTVSDAKHVNVASSSEVLRGTIAEGKRWAEKLGLQDLSQLQLWLKHSSADSDPQTIADLNALRDFLVERVREAKDPNSQSRKRIRDNAEARTHIEAEAKRTRIKQESEREQAETKVRLEAASQIPRLEKGTRSYYPRR